MRFLSRKLDEANRKFGLAVQWRSMPSASIAAVGRITRDLTAAGSLPELLAASAREGAEALGARTAVTLLWNAGREVLEVGAAHGLDPDLKPMLNEALRMEREGIAQDAIRRNEIQVLPDLAAHPPSVVLSDWLALGLKSAFAVPLSFVGKPLGVLAIFDDRPRALAGDDRDLLATLGSLVSAAIHHAQLLALIAERTALLEEANAGLEEANRLKNEFVAIASHELRTPMTAIKGYATLLQEPDLSPEDQADAVRIVGEQTDRLTRILDELLDLATLESGRMPLILSTVDIAMALERTRTLLVRKYPDRPIDLAAKPGLEALQTDADKLEQILLNLVDNACKYSAAGAPITLSVAGGEGEFEIRVHNDGPGLSEAEQAKMFDKFHRLDRTLHQARGTGLGLYITRQLVDLLGGKIRVESGENLGVTVAFSLPVRLTGA